MLNVYPPSGCGVSPLRGGGDRPSPVGASGARGGGGRERSAGSSGTGPAGGRPDAGTRAGREEEAAARRWNAAFSGQRDFAREWRIARGGVSRRSLLPTPGPLSRRFLGAFRTALGSLKRSEELVP